MPRWHSISRLAEQNVKLVLLHAKMVSQDWAQQKQAHQVVLAVCILPVVVLNT